jgi:hypothetical protein
LKVFFFLKRHEKQTPLIDVDPVPGVNVSILELFSGQKICDFELRYSSKNDNAPLAKKRKFSDQNIRPKNWSNLTQARDRYIPKF